MLFLFPSGFVAAHTGAVRDIFDLMSTEILKSIKRARQFALEGNYDAAATFYAGIDGEILRLLLSFQHEPANAPPVGVQRKWESLRGKIKAELQDVSTLKDELMAFSTAASQVKHERGLFEGGAPSQDPPVRPSHSSAAAAPTAGGRGAMHHIGNAYGIPAPFRTPQDDEPSSGGVRRGDGEVDRGGGLFGPPPPVPSRKAGRHLPLRRHPADASPGTETDSSSAAVVRTGWEDHPKFGPPAPLNTAAINERLYGDRDRFAPPKAAGAVSRPSAAAGSGGPPTGATPRVNAPPFPPFVGGGPEMGFVPPTAALPRPSAAAPANGGGRPVKSGGGDGARKPPVPKFGRGGPGSAVPAGGVGPDGRPGPFVPRPGDEELVALIESQKLDGLTTQFEDIAGQAAAKALLEEAVILPIQVPGVFTGARRPWRGILMYGPPGTGKTMLAKAVAGACKTTFFNVSNATMTSKWRGDSEKLWRVLFEMARHYSPSVIFIDEIDSLCGQRGEQGEHEATRRAMTVLLTEMDGIQSGGAEKTVLALGATNHPWDIDEAMRRRLERRIYIPLPTKEDRAEILRLATKDVKVASDLDMNRVTDMLEVGHYSAADVTIVVREAVNKPLRRVMTDPVSRLLMRTDPDEFTRRVKEEPVTMEDFREAVKSVSSSIRPEQIKRFEQWQREFGIA